MRRESERGYLRIHHRMRCAGVEGLGGKTKAVFLEFIGERGVKVDWAAKRTRFSQNSSSNASCGWAFLLGNVSIFVGNCCDGELIFTGKHVSLDFLR